MTTPAPMDEQDLRKQAIKCLKAKRELGAHVLAYVMVNALLVVIWFMTTPGEFFWPAFPILGWGIGLAFNVWDVMSPVPTEDKIRAEMDRIARRG